MKKVILSVLLVIGLSINFYSQQSRPEVQITQTGIYSVDIPHLDIANDMVYLVYGTNFSFYKFPVEGPSEPITNPINPVEGASPWRTDIAVSPDGNNVAIAYVDYKYDYNTGKQFYGCYLVKSTNGGETWGEPALLDTVQLGNTLYNYQFNLPIVEYSDNNNLYVLWRTDLDHADTNAVYLSINNSPKIRIDNDSEVEYAINLSVVSDFNNDVIAVSYGKQEDYNTKFYVRLSTDSGENFGDEILIKDDGQTFINIENFTKVLHIAPNLFYYIFSDFSHGPYYYVSDDYGATWSYGGVADYDRWHFANIQNIYSHNSFAKVKYNDDGKIYASYILLSYDISDWGEPNALCSDSAQIGYAGSFLDVAYDYDKLATAWIDSRTGNEEIFYNWIHYPIEGAVDENENPTNFKLSQNYPNPFNPTTTISYVIARSEATRQSTTGLLVQLKVYDALGREVATLVNKEQAPGKYSVQFNATNLPSGIYFYTLRAGNFKQTKKMILMK